MSYFNGILPLYIQNNQKDIYFIQNVGFYYKCNYSENVLQDEKSCDADSPNSITVSFLQWDTCH